MSNTSVRTLDRGNAPERFARGWHCVGLARDFADGKPHGLQAFGGKIVIWADKDGQFHALDSYCRHMGGDLSQGSVKDGNIACPFHDWRWNGKGKCESIPYARRVPLRARTQTFPTTVVNDQLFVWHDPEGNPPIAEQAIPEIEGLAEGEFSDWVWNSVLIEGSHCREIIDNTVDMAHFFYIHGAYPTSFITVTEGHVSAQLMTSKSREDIFEPSKHVDPDKALLSSQASYYGPSYMIDMLHNDMGNGAVIESVLINCHYPVTSDSFLLQWGVAVRKQPGVDEVTSTKIAKAFSKNFGDGFLQDVEIWRNKVPVQNPLLCEEDGPVYQNRRWYEQFYVDVADITPEMTERFEFEVDTEHAQVQWRAEVADNIAKRDAERAAAESEQAAQTGEPVTV